MMGTQDTSAGGTWSHRIRSRKADTDGRMLVLTGFLIFIQAVELYHPHLIHTVNLIYIILHKHAQRLVKLTVNLNHHSRGPG